MTCCVLLGLHDKLSWYKNKSKINSAPGFTFSLLQPEADDF